MDSQNQSGFAPEAERVARELREQIIEGRRSPGSKLVEREIGEDMGVSRVPVRDALKILIGEGLAVARPFSWAVVWQPSERDIDDLIEVRSAIETLAFSLAAQRATPEDVQDLVDDLSRGRVAFERGDAIGARRAAADFHATVNRISGNSVLRELFRVTDSRMRWLLAQHDDLSAMLAEHGALCEAIAAGDHRLAALLGERHVGASREIALKRLSAISVR